MIDQLHDSLQHIEHVWPKLRILVVGDAMLDRYIWGTVGRISPEAPVPIVCTTHHSEQPGGAANVTVNIAHLGAVAILVSFVGADENRMLLESGLRANGIEPVLVESAEFPTVTKLRVLGNHQQMLRIDSERLGPRPQADYDCLLAAALDQLRNVQALVLSDYAKGVLAPEVCQTLIVEARRLGIPVLVDPKNADFSRYRGATTICPNLGELSAAANSMVAGEDAKNLQALLIAAEKMVSQFDFEFLTATLSEKGIALVRPGNRLIAPADARQVFDVSGAGDTVIAVLALALASGLRPETGVELANMAAGIVVGKVGTVPVERHELLAALAPDLALSAADKIVSRDELSCRVAAWRANGEKVVFTNGCFDLLHVGHIAVLEQARRAGDRLVIAINSDASVSSLKGPTRPVVGENERARVLAALAAVDAVVVFGEPTPLNLILLIRPDVLVKGGDYNMEGIVGAREVLSWGGRVKIVPTIEGFSTTRLIERGAAGASPAK
jgi:D-beta-D-heptose 7-phosphate kinase / D-beta-D-heptose 1-phosphate adenosyltransferase